MGKGNDVRRTKKSHSSWAVSQASPVYSCHIKVGQKADQCSWKKLAQGLEWCSDPHASHSLLPAILVWPPTLYEYHKQSIAPWQPTLEGMFLWVCLQPLSILLFLSTTFIFSLLNSKFRRLNNTSLYSSSPLCTQLLIRSSFICIWVYLYMLKIWYFFFNVNNSTKIFIFRYFCIDST